MMRLHLVLPWVALALWPGLAAAVELSLPQSAVMAREQRDDAGSYALPIGPWANGAVPVREVLGNVTRQAWRLGGASSTTLQMMDTLEAQLVSEGFSTIYRCDDAQCGGFDFRFAIPVLPPPEMFVDLFDYRFLAAGQGEGANASHITFLVSRSGAAIYLQITQIIPGDAGGASSAGVGAAVSAQPPASDAAAPIASLKAGGRAVLADLDFGTGAAALGAGPFASLAALAEYLKADPNRRIALVGHTDTVGGYDANLALSRRRARAVMDRLIGQYAVPAAQMEAEGIAYLAPRASNTARAGREANRRVEAVLLSGD